MLLVTRLNDKSNEKQTKTEDVAWLLYRMRNI